MAKNYELDDIRQAIFDLKYCALKLTQTQIVTGIDLSKEIDKLEKEVDKLKDEL